MRRRAPDSPGGQRCRRSARFVPQPVAPVATFLSAERIVRAGRRTCVIAARIKNWLTRSSAPRSVGTSSARRGRAHQPPDLHQSSQRPVRANHVGLDVAPVARHDIIEVLLVCERQSGEVIHRIALAALGPVPDAAPAPEELVEHVCMQKWSAASSWSCVLATTRCRLADRNAITGVSPPSLASSRIRHRHQAYQRYARFRRPKEPSASRCGSATGTTRS